MQSGITVAKMIRWAGRSLAGGYLLLLVLFPLGEIVATSWEEGWDGIAKTLQQPVALSALFLTFELALLTAVINGLLGTLVAYGLTRYRIPGSRLLNALVDLPFAIPTAVSGIMLLILYGPMSAVGHWFNLQGLEIIYARPGIVLALLFITFPFTVRAVQPLVEGLNRDLEDAARTMGASPWQVFAMVVWPAIVPGIASGFVLTFSRAIAEFGSVIMVAGNIPLKTQLASVLIYGQVESSDMTGASIVSLTLLLASGLMLVIQQFIVGRATTSRDV